MEIDMDDLNLVLLEGTVFGEPTVDTLFGGKKALNFVVENVRKSRKGVVASFTYNVVCWHDAEIIAEQLEEGSFVRIRGHLQHGEVELANGKMFRYAKVCADSIDVAKGE